MIMEWAGVTEEQYEATRKLVNWEREVPKGGMLHVSAITDKGLRVVDIWESAEEFKVFVDNRLMPGVQQLSIEGEPSVEIHPVHTLFTPTFEHK
jgi:hypothetical protein